MSLTSFLKNSDITQSIDRTFDKPSIAGSPALKAEPNTRDYALIGTAFDYVLRFKLERGHEEVEKRPWVAERGCEMMKMFQTEEYERQENKEFECDTIIQNAKEEYQNYLETGEMTDELLGYTIDLAKLDGVFRGGRMPDDFGNYKEGNMQDLRKLYETIPEELTSHKVSLNPAFGEASQLVNGADADIFLGDTLIDVKTTKYYNLKKDYWHQLIGYAVLSDLDSETEIPQEVGIYFSRHGVIWKTSAERIYENEEYEGFKEEFKEKAEGHFSSGTRQTRL